MALCAVGAVPAELGTLAVVPTVCRPLVALAVASGGAVVLRHAMAIDTELGTAAVIADGRNLVVVWVLGQHLPRLAILSTAPYVPAHIPSTP